MATETRNLILKTSWISSSTDPNTYYQLTIDNAIGKIEEMNESYTWYNVNLQQILGDGYYNRYTKFSIRSVEIKTALLSTTYKTNSADANSDIYNNTMIEYYLSGLNFDPSVNRVLVQTAVEQIIPTNSAGTGFSSASPTLISNQAPIYYFSKPTTSVNIKVDRNVLNTRGHRTVNSVNDVIGPSIFMFEIVGIN
jgi:hypothetical protein